MRYLTRAENGLMLDGQLIEWTAITPALSGAWTMEPMKTATEVHARTGHWLDLRDAQIVWRVLHPELHTQVGGRGFPTHTTSEQLSALSQQANSTARTHVNREVELAWLWRRRSHAGIRIDEVAVRTQMEAIEIERREVIRDTGVDLTSISDATRNWLLSQGIHMPHGLSHEHWDKALYTKSCAPAFERFKVARTLALDENKLHELAEHLRSGRVHPTIPAMAAVTGRQQISGPAMQNLPERLRPLIMADEGKVVVGCDLHAVEPHVAAWLSGDPTLTKHLQSGDVYSRLAEQVGTERKPAKVAFLATLYGQGATSLGRSLGLSVDDARQLLASIWATYPRLHAWIQDVTAATELKTGFGRPLPIPPGKDYAKVNYVVQGTAKDLLTTATLAAKHLDLLLPVHDELVVQCAPDGAETVATELQQAMTIRLSDELVVTGEAEIYGERWGK